MVITSNKIILFDSGVGGITTLHTLIEHLPEIDFIFFGDHKNAPYGTKDPRTLEGIIVAKITELIVDFNPLAVIIACNTATSVAIATLRKQFTIPIFGLEPALKVAMDDPRQHRVAVIATPLTLKGKKFKTLQNRYAQTEESIPIPAPGLMELVETALLQKPDHIKDYLTNLLTPFLSKHLTHLVLGCTHYIFLEKILKEILPKTIKVVNGNEGLARHVCNTLNQQNIPRTESGSVQFLTSGDQGEVEKMGHYLSFLQKISC